jgi:hypothetical protein
MHKRNLLIFSVLTVLATGSCTCKKIGGLDPVSVGLSDSADASTAAGVTETSPSPAAERTEVAATTVAASRQYSAACPDGMRAVTGDYCKSVEYRCLKGREVTFSPDPAHPGGLYKQKTVAWTCNKPEGCPVPYYCDKFVEGYAVCGTKEAKGSKDKVPDTKSMRFCIDEYEYPNIIGKKPAVMVTWYDAKKSCTDAGKRLCDDDEWGLACEGPDHVPYGYGWERNSQICNIDKPYRMPNLGVFGSGGKQAVDEEVERLSQSMPIGENPKCVSPFGVHDMTGNVDEWTNNVTRGGKPYHSIFAGGHWAEGARNRCRPRTDSHNEGFRFYAEGFRCCADPK